MIHELKELPLYFDAVANGSKTFELRRGDRDFHIGDFIALNEWTERDGYTGRALLARITYMLYIDRIIGANTGYVVLSIERVAVVDAARGPLSLDNLRPEVETNG